MTVVMRWYTLCALLGSGIGILLGIYWGSDDAPFRGVMTLQVGRVGAVDIVVPDKEAHSGDIRNIGGNQYYGLEPGFRMLMSVEELYRYVTVMFDHRRARRELLEPPYISELNNFEGAILEVVVRAEHEQQAKSFLRDIEDSVLKEHRKYFDSTVAPLVTLRDRLASWYDRLQPNLTISARESPGDDQAVSVDDVVRITELLYKLDRALAPPNTHLTYKIGDVQIERLSNLKHNLHVFGGGMLGLVLSLFGIACIELVKNIKNKRA